MADRKYHPAITALLIIGLSVAAWGLVIMAAVAARGGFQ